MKNSIWIILFSIVVVTNAKQIKVSNDTPLMFYNHSPIAKLNYRQKLRQISKVKMDQAKEIARKKCNDQTIESQKITHRGQLLYYKITTQHCNIEINALDGAIIKKDIYE